MSNNSQFSVTGDDGTLTLWQLAVPLLVESVLNTLISSVNTSVISDYSKNAVNAVGTVGVLMNMLYIVATVISTGATVIISNYIGTGRKKNIQETTFAAMSFCAVIGVFLSVSLSLCASGILSFMNLTGQTYEYGLHYFRFLSATYFLTVINSVALALLRCFGFPRYSVMICIAGGGLKLLLTACFLKFPVYAPISGIAGLCVASLVATLFQLMLCILAVKKTGIVMKKPDCMKVFLSYIWKMLKIGTATAVSACSVAVSGVVTTSFVASMGDDALLACTCVNTLVGYTHTFSYNVGTANALLAGRLYGSGRHEDARRMCFSLVKRTVAVNLLVAMMVVLFYRPLVGLLSNDPVVIAMCFAPLVLNLITTSSRAISHVYEHALRAAGDVNTVMIVTLLSCWICAVGLAYLTGVKWQMGVIGCYIGIAVDEIVRTAVSLIRWRSNKWINIKL